MKFVWFYYVEEFEHSSSLQDSELRLNRFVDMEAVDADTEEDEDEINVNLGSCASKVFVLNLTHLCRLFHRQKRVGVGVGGHW